MTDASPPRSVVAAVSSGWAGDVVIGEPLAEGTTSRTWHAVVGADRYVLKVTADRARFVLPGLAVAAELARRGLRTGSPVPAADGGLGVETDVDGRAVTVSLLQFEPGTPVDVSTSAGVVTAAGLLATVHTRILERPMPAVPSRLLDWFESFLPADDPARVAWAAVREAESTLTTGVVYGDPAPEVLVDCAHTTAALIDWGTPSIGPMVYDVATWMNWVDRDSVGALLAPTLLETYRSRRALTEPECSLLPALRTLAAATVSS